MTLKVDRQNRVLLKMFNPGDVLEYKTIDKGVVKVERIYKAVKLDSKIKRQKVPK